MPLKSSGGPYVGLDIGSNFIKACEVECKGGRPNLKGLAVLPTPSDLVVNNEVIDPVALGKLIKQTLAEAGIRSRKVIASVAGQSGLVVRIIEVPHMSRAELEQTMKWEMERHVPFAAESVIMDFQPLVSPDEVPEGQNIEVLLAVAQENMVNRHVEAIQQAGLQPLAIDIEPLATSRALLDLSNGTGPSGTVALIDLGASTTDISIYRDGRLTFTRSIQIAGGTLTKAISDILGQPLAEAERLKKELAAVPEQNFQPAAGPDLFGDAFGVGFGAPEEGPVLGGTFGTADPGASTATEEPNEPVFDIAGGGFSTDAFTTPSEGTEGGEAGPADEPAPFDLTGAPPTPAATAHELAGPAPTVNPFDPDAGAATEPGGPDAAAPAAGASPFDIPAGPVPGGDPFAPADSPFDAPFGQSPFGMPDPGSATAPGEPTAMAPAAMTDEEYLRTQIADAIMPVLHELVTELRRSLDFYRNRANGLGAEKVLICGGTSRIPGLASFLAANLETPVEIGNPLGGMNTAKADPAYLQEIGPVFPVSVGLAVRELLVDVTPPRPKKSAKKK